MSFRQQCLPLPRKGRKRSSPSSDTNHNDTNKSSSASFPTDIASLASMDAMEYLRSVQQQASSLPDVFLAPSSAEVSEELAITNRNHNHHNDGDDSEMQNAIDGSAAARDYLLSNRVQIIPLPSNLKPYIPGGKGISQGTSNDALSSWVNRTIHNFSLLRSYLKTCHDGLKHEISKQDYMPVPKSREAFAWHIFCLGEEGRNEEAEYCSDDDHDDEKSHTAMTTRNDEEEDELSKYNIPKEGHGPSTKLMSQFDQIIIRRVLSHFTHYISSHGLCIYKMSTARAHWMYALLARLEKPLHRDEASMLMEMLRSLCRMRNDLGVDVEVEQMEGNDDEKFAIRLEELKMIHVLIALVGVYFDQCSNLDKLFGV